MAVLVFVIRVSGRVSTDPWDMETGAIAAGI
jgi:hypothetical protein